MILLLLLLYRFYHERSVQGPTLSVKKTFPHRHSDGEMFVL